MMRQPHRAGQAFMLRIAALLVLLGGTIVAGIAQAQQPGTFFGDFPPRPPGSIPNGMPPQPPPVQYGQPGQSPAARYGSRPGFRRNHCRRLPAPRPPRSRRPARSGRAMRRRPLARLRRSKPRRAASRRQAVNRRSRTPSRYRRPTTPIVTEMPTQKIENARAVFSGLDKITGRIISFDAAIGETVQFGALQVTARVCYTRPPTEATNTDAFVEVDEVTLQGEIKRIFNGWMFAASPGLHAVEHPIYDVWLTDCSSPAAAKVAEPALRLRRRRRSLRRLPARHPGRHAKPCRSRLSRRHWRRRGRNNSRRRRVAIL